MLLQIQMQIDDDSYEILELNTSEPIIFDADNNKYEQHAYNEKNNQVILIVPREGQIIPGRL